MSDLSDADLDRLGRAKTAELLLHTSRVFFLPRRHHSLDGGVHLVPVLCRKQRIFPITTAEQRCDVRSCIGSSEETNLRRITSLQKALGASITFADRNIRSITEFICKILKLFSNAYVC
jgi:hypothetical protein